MKNMEMEIFIQITSLSASNEYQFAPTELSRTSSCAPPFSSNKPRCPFGWGSSQPSHSLYWLYFLQIFLPKISDVNFGYSFLCFLLIFSHQVVWWHDYNEFSFHFYYYRGYGNMKAVVEFLAMPYIWIIPSFIGSFRGFCTPLPEWLKTEEDIKIHYQHPIFPTFHGGTLPDQRGL